MPVPSAPLGRGDRGAAVAQLHRTLEALNRSIDPLERDARFFGDSTENVLRELQEQSGIPVTGGFDADTYALVTRILADIAPFTVYGTVTDGGGEPMVGATVVAADADLRRSELLGKARTDSGGEYEVRYAASRFTRAEKASADVVVRALFDGEQVAASPVAFNAPAELQIDLASPTRHGPSELERIQAALAPLLDGVAPAELTNADVDFLSREAGIEWRRIDWLARASTAEQTPEYAGMPTAAFYGWFRSGLPVEPGRLWAIPTADLVAELGAALDQGIVPAELRDNLDGVTALIEQIKHDRLLAAPAVGTTATLKTPSRPSTTRAAA